MDRVAAVTGGAGAIGGAIAAALSADHPVEIVDRPVDLESETGTRAVAREILARHGRCDVLVHAAADFEGGGLDTVRSETWRRVQAVNVESVLWLAQELVPAMRERGFGRIVLIVSDTVFDPPLPVRLPYVTSKAALVGLGRALARELGGHGITVNCVAPGLTDTPVARRDIGDAAFDAVRARQALDRSLTPADTAATVAFLASDAAGALTGQTLCPDGGLVLR